jgi:hypothetical protein
MHLSHAGATVGAMPEWFGWDIRREGRAWTPGEARHRWELVPKTLELWQGRLLRSEEDRIKLLGLLLENVGADHAVRLGDPAVWIAAAEGLQRELAM